ncbi:MAG: glycosyltransferase [bacterium]
MKILIATPLYPPDIGGPAKYAQAVAGELRGRRHKVEVVAYTRVGRRLPPGLRHAAYLARLLRAVRGAEFILTLDTWSAGLPALLAAKLARKKLVVRIGGDIVWEQYVERTGEMVKLSEFYVNAGAGRTHRLSTKERLIFKLTRVFMQHADVLLFNTLWQRDIWLEPYGFKKEKSQLLENYYGGVLVSGVGVSVGATAVAKTIASVVVSPVFVSATRGIKYKNISALGRVFARLKKTRPQVVLDTKPLPPAENHARLEACYAVIIPSISEVNPNLVWEALSFGKPFICPIDSGCRDQLEGLGFFVDTSDQAQLEQTIEQLLDAKIYNAFVKKIKEFTFTHSWSEITDEILDAAQLPTAAMPQTQNALRVLMLSGDRKIREAGSGAHKRFLLQQSVVDKLDVFVWPQGSSVWEVLRAARCGNYGVVTTQDPFWRGLVGWLAARIAGARLNVQVHADLRGQSRFRQALAAFVLRRAHSVRVVSERVRDALPQNLKASVSVLPIYVDLAPFRKLEHQSNPRFEKVIVWIGRFEQEKDPVRMLEVFQKVRAAGVDAGLIMLGAGSLEKELRAAVLERGLKGLVEFPGWHDPKDYLQYADVAVCTSVAESWGASIVEALASGVPVVAPDVGVARMAGAQVVPREQLAEKTVEVLHAGARGQLELKMLNAHEWAEQWRETLWA